jgi:hypothetical protein
MSAFPHEAYINNNVDMSRTMWHVDINEIWPKSVNDMMQCVTCNKSSLFAPQKKKKKSLNKFEMGDTN